MTNEIAELRDLNLEKESLLARKAAIKQKLAEIASAEGSYYMIIYLKIIQND